MVQNIRVPICRSAEVSCGKTADWIRMPFGVVRGSVEDGCIRWAMGVVIVEGKRRFCR